MKGQNRPRREPRKEKQERVPKQEAVQVREWVPAIEPLVPRECPHRGEPGHYLITCPACLGFPD